MQKEQILAVDYIIDVAWKEMIDIDYGSITNFQKCLDYLDSRITELKKDLLKGTHLD